MIEDPFRDGVPEFESELLNTLRDQMTGGSEIIRAFSLIDSPEELIETIGRLDENDARNVLLALYLPALVLLQP